MSFRRRWVVYGLVVIVLGGNLASFIFNRQLWPYSQYPMFAEARELTFETLALVGEPVADVRGQRDLVAFERAAAWQVDRRRRG